MRLKIEFSYRGQHETFSSAENIEFLPNWVGQGAAAEVVRLADNQVMPIAIQRINTFFQGSAVASPLHQAFFELPNSFIIKSQEKLLSSASDSLQAKHNREIIKNTPEGFYSKATYCAQTSSGEIVPVEVPVTVLRIIDDLSQGVERVLVPLITPKPPEKKLGRSPQATTLHVPTTANCSLDTVFEKYLPALRRNSPNAMAVGFIENPEGNYLIITDNKMDYIKIKHHQLIDIGLVTWYIAKDVPALLKKIFSHIPLQAESTPSLPQFMSWEQGYFDEIPNLYQERAPQLEV